MYKVLVAQWLERWHDASRARLLVELEASDHVTYTSKKKASYRIVTGTIFWKIIHEYHADLEGGWKSKTPLLQLENSNSNIYMYQTLSLLIEKTSGSAH